MAKMGILLDICGECLPTYPKNGYNYSKYTKSWTSWIDALPVWTTLQVHTKKHVPVRTLTTHTRLPCTDEDGEMPVGSGVSDLASTGCREVLEWGGPQPVSRVQPGPVPAPAEHGAVAAAVGVGAEARLQPHPVAVVGGQPAVALGAGERKGTDQQRRQSPDNAIEVAIFGGCQTEGRCTWDRVTSPSLASTEGSS